MRKLIFFLSVFFLSCFYSKAQECGTIDFPRFIPDTVCTLDSVLLATDAELANNQITGSGILEWNNSYYFNPEEQLAGQYIQLFIAGYDSCGQYNMDSATVFVKKCQDCREFQYLSNPIPDSICRNDDRFLMVRPIHLLRVRFFGP